VFLEPVPVRGGEWEAVWQRHLVVAAGEDGRHLDGRRGQETLQQSGGQVTTAVQALKPGVIRQPFYRA
jgi:hypothetical protein